MADPEIRYTTTADGVSIAYYTMGEGYPLVVTSNVLWSHLRIQPFREYHRSGTGQGLGRGLQVVRYDARGTGLSDRSTLDFSMDARLRDLECVVERLKLTRFAIFGWWNGAPAARFPARAGCRPPCPTLRRRRRPRALTRVCAADRPACARPPLPRCGRASAKSRTRPRATVWRHSARRSWYSLNRPGTLPFPTSARHERC